MLPIVVTFIRRWVKLPTLHASKTLHFGSLGNTLGGNTCSIQLS